MLKISQHVSRHIECYMKWRGAATQLYTNGRSMERSIERFLLIIMRVLCFSTADRTEDLRNSHPRCDTH